MTLENLATITPIILAIVAGGYFLFKEFRKRQKKYRRWLQGAWGNEGDITGNDSYTHYISIGIKTDLEDGVITGIIESRNLETDGELNNISINGRIFFKTARVRMSTVWREGKHVNLGRASIKVNSKRLLTWKLSKGDETNYPNKTILWKSE